MKRISRGKRTALVAAVGLVVVALASWKPILTTLHLRRLQSEPGYFTKLLDEPESTCRGQALLAYVKTPAGKEVLATEYATRLLDALPYLAVKFQEEEDAITGVLGVPPQVSRPVWWWLVLPGGPACASVDYSGHPLEEFHRLFGALQGDLGEEFALPDSERHRFSVSADIQKIHDVGFRPPYEVPGLVCPTTNEIEDAEYFLVLRSVADQ